MTKIKNKSYEFFFFGMNLRWLVPLMLLIVWHLLQACAAYSFMIIPLLQSVFSLLQLCLIWKLNSFCFPWWERIDVVNCAMSVAGMCCLQFHHHPITAVCVLSAAALPCVWSGGTPQSVLLTRLGPDPSLPYKYWNSIICFDWLCCLNLVYRSLGYILHTGSISSGLDSSLQYDLLTSSMFFTQAVGKCRTGPWSTLCSPHKQ